MLGVDLSMLLPVVAFLLLNKPHDCYACLGKDPDRIYSSYQLTRGERAHMKLMARFNARLANRLSQNTEFQKTVNRTRNFDNLSIMCDV